MISGDSANDVGMIDNQTQYISYTTIPIAGWSVAVVIPKSEVEKDLNKFKFTFIGLLLITLIILGVIISFVTKKCYIH